ncbi:MAG TPA: phosphoribosyltransferase [Anaerolineae bacterium]|nr:phosphoribosyltransferase [Anaerolineae bacterium]HID85487.1 phosphoribosyltransferase [Anaerolineales bacterium]HIQ07973.1 phosphoribosyltransferase [Anaerolineaceae bacterium]
MRREILTWEEVDRLIDHLLPQFETEFDAMVIITRGGLIPGGMLAEALNLNYILTAAVDFPSQVAMERAKLVAWPKFLQFPEEGLLTGRRTLIVDDVWGSGRTMTAVRARVLAAGATPYTCVLHFNPHRSLFGSLRPDYYAAITDAYIVYPWEIDRGIDKVPLTSPLGEG